MNRLIAQLLRGVVRNRLAGRIVDSYRFEVSGRFHGTWVHVGELRRGVSLQFTCAQANVPAGHDALCLLHVLARVIVAGGGDTLHTAQSNVGPDSREWFIVIATLLGR